MIKGEHLRLDLDGGMLKIRGSAGIDEEWEALEANFDRTGCPDRWYLCHVDEVDMGDQEWTPIFGAPEVAEVCIPTSTKTGKLPKYNIDFDWLVGALEKDFLKYHRLSK
jgi:hypothetical protein